MEPHTDKAGRRSVGFKVFPVLDTGAAGRFGDLWIRVSEGPDALDAFVDSLPRVVEAYAALRARMEKAGEWKPRAKVSTAKVAKATPAAPAAPAAPRSVLDDIIADLPA